MVCEFIDVRAPVIMYATKPSESRRTVMKDVNENRAASFVTITVASILLLASSSLTHADECITDDDCPGGVCVTALNPNICSFEEKIGEQGDPCNSDSDCQGVCDTLEGSCEGDCKWNQDCPEGAYCEQVDNICEWE
jgi:hypothetical protein